MAKKREQRRHTRVPHPGGEDTPIRFELFSAERFEKHAISLAQAQKNTCIVRGDSQIPRVRENFRILNATYKCIAEAVHNHEAITPAAEWLLDNFHIIEEQVSDIYRGLPNSYYFELPKLTEGVLANYPRIYGIVWAVVAHTDSRFDSKILKDFVRTYQTIDPLTLSELWAIPITLKVLLIENLRRLSVRIMRSQNSRKLANEFVDQIEQIATHTNKSDFTFSSDFFPSESLRQSFVVQILQRLHEPHPGAIISLDFLDDWLKEQGASLNDIVHREHSNQIAGNLTVRNIITSMRAISIFEWPQFFEEVSLVDERLKTFDNYGRMDFLTRDRYRHAIEDLAKYSPLTELDIANKVISKVNAIPEGEVGKAIRDPGYFLIGSGRYEFEKELGYYPALYQYLLRAYVKYAGISYVGSLTLWTSLLLAVIINVCFDSGLTGMPLMLIILFSLLPASDIAVGVLNHLIISYLPPRHMPRFELTDNIPENLSTFVVVPTMFSTEAGVIEQVKHLEIHYMANQGGHVRYALLSDWLDADQETLATDEALLNTARAEIKALNAKYGQTLFFVFHRKRCWNPSEGKWMGWERKRGKLHEFNRLLRGATDTTFLPMDGSPAAAPSGICYVITLDADTKLPMGAVAKLVGVAAHPLNQPVFDPKTKTVTDGYGILQPRVTHTLPLRAERSMFHQIYAGAAGTDSYSSPVSELYQDLFALGTYSGKGLYHVDSFEAALAGRIPENTLLSHDLLESVFVRCALVNDIEFFEEFPSHVEVSALRDHRWTRGDWQLLPWIFGPRGKGMPMIGRWKMIDNLRRSLSAPFALFAIIATWIFPNAPALAIISFVMLALALPQLIGVMKRPDQTISFALGLWMMAKNMLWVLGGSLVELTLLPHRAWLKIDAILRTLVRLFFTRRQLLNWVTASQAREKTGYKLQNFIQQLVVALLIVSSAVVVLLLINPEGVRLAAPFLLLWGVAPVVARGLSLPPWVDRAELLLPQDNIYLRLAGRRIWRFFTTFVTANENFLPPDNFQESPNPVLAHRTSPTNIGLYLLSAVAARQFGWLGLLDYVDRIEQTVSTLNKLSRINGHFYNWYDTQDLRVLEPAYVSTVDSGNLAGNLLALAQECREIKQRPLDFSIALAGILDTYNLTVLALENMNDGQRTQTVTLQQLRKNIIAFGELLDKRPADIEEWSLLWQQLKTEVITLLDLVQLFTEERKDKDSELLAWVRLLHNDIFSHLRDIDVLIPWFNFSSELSLLTTTKTQAVLVQKNLSLETKLSEMLDCYHGVLTGTASLTNEALAQNGWKELSLRLNDGAKQLELLSTRLDKLIAQLDLFFHEMDFSFLYNTDCNLFSLGYQAKENKLDPSHYDLLASEARLSSFIAIAKRDVPVKHWSYLGRRLIRVAQDAILLSWSGSMFEYLMPSLIMFTPRYSLLDYTCRKVVKRQIEYGKEQGLPWGISESAYNVRDLAFTYQYSAFGIPGLGMKRGLGEDQVIAPYATALAAMYLPHDAVENFMHLEKVGAIGRYGFYEALDFTPIRLAEGQRVAVVQCYMAHHQGMSLVAFSNVVHDGAIRHRFHMPAFIKAVVLLLQERAPSSMSSSALPLDLSLLETKETLQPPLRRIPSPTSLVPSAHLLSNGRYSLMLTAAGSGYSLWKNIAITRWREDVTRDAWGSYIYLRDTANGRVWSAGYQPTVARPDHYEAIFSEDRVRITRRDENVISTLEVIISPEDDAEIRRLSLTNNSSRIKEIEITSYAEIVLVPMAADIAHPAFSNLFIQTEYLPQMQGLIAHRRPRLSNDPVVWAAHVLAIEGSSDGFQYETDRARFIGRGQTLQAPLAVMDGRPLTNTVGAVLDPIFSMRTRVRILPGATVHVTYTTLVSDARPAIIDAAEKYLNIGVFDRVSSLAWTHTQVQLHFLRTRPDEAQLFQELGNRLVFASVALRPSAKWIQMNTLSVKGLWRHGISGDKPIVLLRVKEAEDRTVVEQLLRAHGYWRMKGLIVDLVIMNEKEHSYVDHLQSLLDSMVRDNLFMASHHENEQRGAVFVLRSDQLSLEERRQIQAVARVMLVSNRGTLAEQLLRYSSPETDYVTKKDTAKSQDEPISLAVPMLNFFNGLGGFSKDGREYVIALNNGQWTPVPWVNVIANPEFGFMVSELGSGCTWFGNSRENQLTPWSNDPVCDPPGEVLYLRDDETYELWTPTALPIRVENAPYIIRHGQGYSHFEHASHGIHSDLLQFVSPDDPVKLSVLTLKNISGRNRRLTITAYVEWVLGTSRSAMASHIVTELDPATGAIFANNPWDVDFGQGIAFADLAGGQIRWTGNRTEFIGRNGSLDAPAGLLTTDLLKNRVGAGLDPCAALEMAIELEAESSIEITFLLGQGKDRRHASDLIQRYRAATASAVFFKVNQSWEQILGKIQVKTPDHELDILLNRWLLYQTLSCRMWARAGFYQLGGAFGFRDQLQDSMALSVTRPDLTRAHILRAAAHQFTEGDVQHWWHPPTGRGVRTRFSDDRVWLPYVVAYYIKVSGDQAILLESLPFLEGVALEAEQDDAYFEPSQSQQTASLYEHCARAIDISLNTGAHGLPLMGSGDWNDGMSRVGNQGKGESVWMAWFLLATLSEFTHFAEQQGDTKRANRWRKYAKKLKESVEAEAWDGAWYRRAFFDDGTPLGSASNTECRIDSIAQSWAIISGAGELDRSRHAMSSVKEYLTSNSNDLVLLFTLPFDKTEKDPGYIKSYPPGIRENGGQYTHAAVWVVIAYAMMGEGNQAIELMNMLNPIKRSASRSGAYAYKVEPYVLVADIYSEPPHARRGGWTWYTGAAGWYYRAGIESILGLKCRGNKLFFDPCIPKEWPGYNIVYKHNETTYHINVENPNRVSSGIAMIEIDGVQDLQVKHLPLTDDGQMHQVRVVLGNQ